MSNLRRSEDHAPPLLAWDQALPSAVEREPGDRRTPPAAERLFAALALPWDRQIAALETADEELRQILRKVDRLRHLDARLRQAKNTEQLARQDLLELSRQRQEAISRAVSEADDGPKLLRKRRVDEARAEAATWFDQRIERTRQLTIQRQKIAEREQAQIAEERRELLRLGIVGDDAAVELLRDIAARVQATLGRDRSGRAEALSDWARLRGADERVVHRLRARRQNVVLPGQAVGEGPIHLVAGDRLALIELRRGRDGVRSEEVDGDVRLIQVMPRADEPLGMTNGSLAQLRAAEQAVEQATGMAPHLIVCVSAWTESWQVVGGVTVCGLETLDEAIESREAEPVDREVMKQAARALAMLEVPTPATAPLASLDHLTAVHPEDVPDGVPAVRDLIVLAHERRRERY